MKKIKITKKIALLAGACCVLAVGGYMWLQGGAHDKKAEGPVAQSKPRTDTIIFPAHAPQLAFLQVEAVKSFPEPFVDSLNARLDYDDNKTARVFSPVAGRVVEILVDSGTTVKKGTPLLKIDSPDFAAAASDRAKADADLAHKKQIYERAKQLLEAKAIAQRDLEVAEADYHQAEAEAQRALARFNNLSGGRNEKEYVLRAPIDGIVSERKVNIGSEVRPDSADPLFVITDPTHLWVYVDLPELHIDRIEEGQTVYVEVDAFPGERFESTVSLVGQVVDPLTRRIQVRCELDNNHEHKLRAEMFARVQPIKEEEDAKAVLLPRIPNAAIFTQGLYSFIFVELSPGQFQRRQVELKLRGRDTSYVGKGLKKGERVVITGALLLNSELSGDI